MPPLWALVFLVLLGCTDSAPPKLLSTLATLQHVDRHSLRDLRAVSETFDVLLVQAAFNQPLYITSVDEKEEDAVLPASDVDADKLASLGGLVSLQCQGVDVSVPLGAWNGTLRTARSIALLGSIRGPLRHDLNSMFSRAIPTAVPPNVLAIVHLLELRNERGDYTSPVRLPLQQGQCSLHVSASASKRHLSNFHGQGLDGVRIPIPYVDASHPPIRLWHLDAANIKPLKAARPHLKQHAQVADTPESCDDVTSFVSEKTVFLEESTTMVNAVLKLMISKIAEPVMKQMKKMVGDGVGDDFPKTLVHNMLAGMPRLVVAHVGNSVSRNVTNVLTDALTESLRRRLTESLTNDLGPFLTKSIWEDATPRLIVHLKNSLVKIVPEHLDLNIPNLLEQSLPIILTHKLTHSMTHALVASLTLTLSNTGLQTYLCTQCYMHNLYCAQCHTSRSGMYYNSYYAAYYSDYFLAHYGSYYTEAMTQVNRIWERPEDFDYVT